MNDRRGIRLKSMKKDGWGGAKQLSRLLTSAFEGFAAMAEAVHLR